MIKNQIIVTFTKASRRGKPVINAVYQEGDTRTEEVIKILRAAADILELKLKERKQ